MTNAPSNMTFVKTSNPIDLRSRLENGEEVSLGTIMMKGLAAQVTEALQDAFEESPPYLMFPMMWAFGDAPGDGYGGPAPSDPAMLYLGLPLAEMDGGACVYACSLEGVVDDLITALMNQETKKIEDADAISICAKIAARLRELANKLDTSTIINEPRE
jgi:hypothetical protein